MLDRSTGKPAKDKTWSPIGKVGFPYDVFYTGAVVEPGDLRSREVIRDERNYRLLWWSVTSGGVVLLVLRHDHNCG